MEKYTQLQKKYLTKKEDLVISLYNKFTNKKYGVDFETFFKKFLDDNHMTIKFDEEVDGEDSDNNEHKVKTIRDLIDHNYVLELNPSRYIKSKADSCNSIHSSTKDNLNKIRNDNQLTIIDKNKQMKELLVIHNKKMDSYFDDIKRMATIDPISFYSFWNEKCNDDEIGKKDNKKIAMCSTKEIIRLKTLIIDYENKRVDYSKVKTAINSNINKYKEIISDKKSIIADINIEVSESEIMDTDSLTDFSDCDDIEEMREPFITKILTKMTREITQSKEFISGFINDQYGPSKDLLYNSFEKLRSSSHETFQSLVKETNLEENKDLQKAAKELKELPLSRMKLDDFKFIDDGNVSLLNIEELNLLQSMLLVENPYDLFGINAFYLPGYVRYIDPKLEESVNLLPFFADLFETSPLNVLSVLAHEIGHKIDPNVSPTNNHDTNLLLKEIVKCLKTKESVSMISHQSGESFSDWFAAEVMFREIQKNYKPEEFKEKIIETIGAECMFISLHFNDSDSSDEIDLDGHFSDVHMMSVQRLNGIFGAHPFVQSVFNCENPYKYCDINGDSK